MVVTVSRAYGAAARAVAQRAAGELGYRLVDDELEVAVATRLGTPADVVESVGERPRGFGERVLEQLGGGLPEVTQPADAQDEALREQRRRALELAVRVVAARGDAIVMGRCAGTILAGRGDLVRVFLQAPLAWRIAHLASAMQMDPTRARAEIARIDEARRTYAREAYRIAWGDPKHYDLVVDTARFGVDGAAAVIVAAVRAAAAG